MADANVTTRFLIISDTHGEELQLTPSDRTDVAIHCGDLTEESKFEEFKTSLRHLKQINAPLKLVITGNHDFTMDIPMFKKKIEEFKRLLNDTDDEMNTNNKLIETEYGSFGEARELFQSLDATSAGIHFLVEGTHHFPLANGALITIYASPYTPSLNDWGFQYDPQQDHDWTIDNSIDVVITHGPPKGILDYTPQSRQRAGSLSLFAAVARARPRLHCFGHIHQGWAPRR